MNTKITKAVAVAALAIGATSANAGIIIPAGEWTLDVNGNVNVYATMTKADDTTSASGGVAKIKDGQANDDAVSINTGLLPAWLGFTGTTRQNDLDVSFTISMQPNVSDNAPSGDVKVPLFRQAFLSFGDKSWGSVKMGKDLGIFGGNAILNDMTLLGVGALGSTTSGNSTSLGGIGTGYIYPAWKGQIAYTTPNFNGLSATVAITNPNQHQDSDVNTTYQDRYGVEAQVEYAFSNGKAWVSGVSYERQAAAVTYDATAIDIGANVNFGNASITAYYYTGEGIGSTMLGGWLGGEPGGVDAGASATGNERDSDGGYVQATYVIPTGTKLGVAVGVSKLDLAVDEAATAAVLDENKRWTVGAYHPLTKHLNLVAEYNSVDSESHNGVESDSDSISLGAILFF